MVHQTDHLKTPLPSSPLPGQAALDTGRIPVVIAVSGHRVINSTDAPELYKAVVKVLNRIRKQSGAETPLVLLSPLAEGADRIGAQAALDVGIHLVVPLPMPRAEYEIDFPDSTGEFHRLLQQASLCFELPYVEGNTDLNIRQPENRDRQYQAVGQYVVRHCQILIALWDGSESSAEDGCGTAAVVKYQLEGIRHTVRYASDGPMSRSRPERNLLEQEEGGLVYHIWTRRQGDETTLDGRLFHERTLHPSAFKNRAAAETYYGNLLKRIAEFNRELASADKKLRAMICASHDGLLPPNLREHLSHSECITLIQYASADALATRFQKSSKRTVQAIHWYIAIGSVMFAIYAHMAYELEWEPVWSLPSFTIALAFLGYLAAIFAYRRAGPRGRDYQNKHQDYRALAEAMRVQLFWNLLGIQEPVGDYYLGKHRTELDWIRNALRNWRTTVFRTTVGTPQDRAASVLRHWIVAQKEYFSGHPDQKRQESREKRVQLFLEAATVFALMVAGLTFLNILIDHKILRGTLEIVFGSALLTAGLIHHYNEQMAFSQQAREQKRLASSFSYASGLIKMAIESSDWAKVLTLFRDAGIVALEENGSWVLTHRERPLEIPAGG